MPNGSEAVPPIYIWRLFDDDELMTLRGYLLTKHKEFRNQHRDGVARRHRG